MGFPLQLGDAFWRAGGEPSRVAPIFRFNPTFYGGWMQKHSLTIVSELVLSLNIFHVQINSNQLKT
ncbi:hypothetical protein CSV71_02085 [Sporosarcina sp. P21c]|nr:hypothetical protein CSV71_02085 [Sporosarcina sp. P21c]